jgi:hypothetical protein
MTHVTFTGAVLPNTDILDSLYRHGYRVVIEPNLHDTLQRARLHPSSVVILALTYESDIKHLGCLLQQQAIPWIGWNISDDASLTLAAYSTGAQAVMPAFMTAAAITRVIQIACGEPMHPPTSSNSRVSTQRVYQCGASIHLSADDVIHVLAGVVAQTMVHRDGREVLMGLSGTGQLLLGHPEDACCLLLRAHTEVIVSIQSWQDAATVPNFAERLRDRIRVLEGWSAMQAHPHLDQRIVSVLTMLAEQFGVLHPHGLLIDVRITHAQLATAVGATRSTVTRLLSDLRTRGNLMTVGSGENERYCLCRWEHTDHLQPRQALQVRVHKRIS